MWQNNVQNSILKVRGIDAEFIKPHKWIVCMIGSDVYTVADCVSTYRETIERQPNLNISIMSLSGADFKPDYHEYQYR